ncbi:teneurin-1 isoform X1 [Thunnus thynnus]|uniref:teneurin-1 isoform X1 n=2 Tax=Thunnus maccoyii TaxID=8240 RepID=UPI001C4B2ABF|nr:teneurin-1 isoform X1 [Thunnus maccoyii]XP_042274856.1 teneurin-1 isoform X1 [Thunnus maccoyii]XP_042274857.1 teneurin-1 isoform X1 [Thunnus maccoyii]XP_042274858.1 teneurin-1 isoform X1 [Thunnus maccoyii]XP_042274859.1 teneurin-1 isoform X1 [Thunnus maccoyii]XP_042274860.1 teneurin-1 isoform X1 [Thunnus maccoyii]XP_042274861.1 teneurin-1 isoform X1 [Thunnus maccoyii]XP_042274862.1 teneurin-1 isoform X1 [Thunnus maccoyii]XP_042274863.1 teneurin-1 isoform X1 [Thunnus maccoyii]XP_04227486
MEEMDSKPYQPLSKGRHEMEMSYTSSSDESEDGRAHHRSYTSRETLPDYTHELRLTLGSHRERQSNYSQPQPDLDFCKAGQMRSPDYHIHPQQQQQQQQHQEEEEALCSGPAAHVHSRGYSLGVGSDVDTEPEVDPSPAHGLQHMWMRGLKSEQSSCLTSRANSALSLTDTEHDRKSEPDNELPSSPGGQFTFRPLPPPPPPPHACTCARPAPYTQVSLQRKTMPTRCQTSQGGQGADTSSSTDQAQLHNSWVLNSNIPLETRHFLFKQGSGSSALLSGAGQGYPLTSGTVYSPPPRPLPRSSVTRPLFTFNKPHRCCNWKCTALSASLLTLTLALLLTYVIAVHLLGLTWHLRHGESQLYDNGLSSADHQQEDRSKTRPTSSIHLLDTLNPENPHAGDREKWVRGRAIDRGEVDIGTQQSQPIPPGLFWRFHMTVHHPTYIKFNLSLSHNALLGVYGRRNIPPTHTQFDFVKLLDGKALPRSLTDPVSAAKAPKGLLLSGLQETGFIEYMDPGTWHLALYNDGRNLEQVLLHSTPIDTMDGCSTDCNGNGECVAGHCHCFAGFLGPDCAKDSCPVLCSGNGVYEKGRCVCLAGWKGAECNVEEGQCIDPTCSNHGSCIQGICICSPAYKGVNCEQVDCVDPQCGGHGVCVRGECVCSAGWAGVSCDDPLPACQEQCSGHGTYLPESDTCACQPNWTGPDCYTELCPVPCGSHGVCSEGQCQCEEGWIGAACDQRACHPRCEEHGQCHDGTCICQPGWEGEHCNIVTHDLDVVVKDGCPGLCSGHGRCTLEQSGWRCVCQAGWSGPGCSVVMETDCSDGTDNDGDGLMDCVDPDCCEQLSCGSDPLCHGSADPLALLQQSPLPPTAPPSPASTHTHSFYRRIRFLLGKAATHTLPGDVPFDTSRVAVIRGSVVLQDGSPLVGVNITFPQHPEYGYTISRQDGSFDLVTLGAMSMTLMFQRPPFLPQTRTIWTPNNNFLVLDQVTMSREEAQPPKCDIRSVLSPYPLVLPYPLPRFMRACVEKGPAVPELQAVQEEVSIPGAFVKLNYLSTRAAGYLSLLRILLTPPSPSSPVSPLGGLSKVHVRASVQGRLYQRWYPAGPGLVHRLVWNKTDVYGQEVWGLTHATVSVGYEYESCPGVIQWERRTALMQGFELVPSNLGGWSLDKHHALNIRSGILHKGNGENVFLSQQPPVISTVMGNGFYRSVPCGPSCSGAARDMMLFAPVALASGPDGSLYVGDFNFIRRVHPDGYTRTILELKNRDTRHSTSPAHKYYLAMDPMGEVLYVSDTSSRRVYRVRNLGQPKDPSRNLEVVAGTGEQCLPFDQSHCGEGRKATEAALNNPRGIAVDKRGVVYFVDGTTIQKINERGLLSTVIGSNGLMSTQPLSCDARMDISQVRLEWPTDLAINPLDNSLYILDNNIVLQVSEGLQVRIVAGRPIHCQVPGIDHHLVSRAAVRATLEAAKAIALSHLGTLFIAETDERRINRIQQVSTNGEISVISGAPTDCDCKIDPNCDCFSGDGGYARDARLKAPSSLAVAPNGTLYIADLGNIRIRAVSPNQPQPSPAGLVEISSPLDQELYLFSQNGSHLYTKHLITGHYLYNFSYGTDGQLSGLTGRDSRGLQVRRDAHGVPLWLALPGGQVYWLSLSNSGTLRKVSAQGHDIAHITYHGNTGLLATKSDENSWTTVYEYNSEGRVTNITLPTGDVSGFHGNLERWSRVEVEASNRENFVTSTNLSASDTIYTFRQDHAQSSYRVSADGSFLVSLASGMELSLSTEPLLPGGVGGGVSPTASRCNISLPGDHAPSLIEWRQRKEQSKTNYSTYERRLRAHNRNLLSIDFDQSTRVGKIYDDHRKFTLHIQYDPLGRPVVWSPSSKYTEVNISYSGGGLLSSIHRGEWSERLEYENDRVVSRAWVNGKIWSYTYADRSIMLLLHSQRRYVFEYEQTDRLVAVTMPSMVKHTLQSLLSIGYYRNIYTPPDSQASFLQDYTLDGRLLRSQYLGTGRNVIYRYTPAARLSEVVYDSTLVTFTYDEASGTVKTIHLTHNGFISSIRYRQTGPLTSRQIFRFSEEGLVNARFDYSYNNFRVTSMQAVINETPLPIDLYRYVDVSGRVEQFGKFSVIFYDLNQVITTHLMKHTKVFNSYGQVVEVQYEILKSIAYWMTIQYDSAGRTTTCDIRVGVDSNVTRYMYEYDADSQLQSASVNERPQWRYSYDLNGNINLLSHGTSARLTPLRYDQRDRITHLGELQYSVDDDGFLRQRANDLFDYNSNGLLTRVFNRVTERTVWYRYDGLGRRVATKTSQGEQLQFFYADLSHPTRVSHLYNHSSNLITSLYYDLQGHLIAMELSSGEEYYVACDSVGTPRAVFSSKGRLVKEILYTPYGEVYQDTNPDFQLVIGFHGGLYDPFTRLVHLGRRDYDTLAGRWTSPNHELWGELSKEPKPFNLYAFKNNCPVGRVEEVTQFTTDIGSWLQLFGFQLHNVVPGFPKPEVGITEQTYELMKTQTKTQDWDSSKVVLGIQCELRRQLRSFISLQRLPLVSEPVGSACHHPTRPPPFGSRPSLLGPSIRFAISHGRVSAEVIGVASEDSRRVAAILNGAVHLSGLSFTVHGCDTHHFLQSRPIEEDLALGLGVGGRVLESGVNVSVSQMSATVNGRTRRFADITLQQGALCLCVRYGGNEEEERARVREEARKRAVEGAWEKERKKVDLGDAGSRVWSEAEKQQLLSGGRVQGYDGYYSLPIEQQPELSDCSSNIHFMTLSEVGGR